MKSVRKILMAVICGALLLGQTSCGMNNTGKGALIGGAGAAALGAGIGALIGGGKGAAIGAGIGAGVGAGAGALIGNKMDKQQKELEEQLKNQASIEQITDRNGLPCIKVTFEGGILFPSGKSTINAGAQKALTDFAKNITDNPGTLIQVFGFTDNTGSMEVNQTVSTNRANAVMNFLKGKGIAADRISAEGIPMSNYVADNGTEAGRAQNRRVEVYITASEEMIEEAQNAAK